jgi:GNAT superfamily N-acetyltransferase
MRFEFDYDYRVSSTYKQKEAKGTGWLTTLPGNSGILLIHGVYLSPEDRNKGIGKKQHKERLDLIRKEFGASISHLMCTANNHNLPELRILNAFGWEHVYDLGDAGVWIKDLSKPDTPLEDDSEEVED